MENNIPGPKFAPLVPLIQRKGRVRNPTRMRKARSVQMMKKVEPLSMQHSPLRQRPSDSAFRSLRLLTKHKKEKINKREDVFSLTPWVGIEAKTQFYSRYANYYRETDKYKYDAQLSPNPHMEYLIHTARSGVVPQPFGLIRRNGTESTLDIHNYRIGDTYASALSASLRHIPSLENINLRGNRLSEKGTISVLSNVRAKTLRKLDLTDNKVGERSIALIIKLSGFRKSQIQYLSLENTGLTNYLVSEICEAFQESRSIRSMNFARNKLSRTEDIAEMISTNSNIAKIDLHWNNFQDVVQLFDALVANTGLVELDLSWNRLGKLPANADPIAKALMENATLRHLDLSHNELTQDQMLAISAGLETNHSIYGIHMFGNQCDVDSKGFIQPRARPMTIGKQHIYTRSLCNYEPAQRDFSNCWICEKWVQVTFKYTPTNQEHFPIYLHLSCDDYAFELLDYESDEYQITRAVPPTGVYFFFSVDGNAKLSSKYKTKKVFDPVVKQIEFWPGFTADFSLTELNYCEFTGPKWSLKEQVAKFIPEPRVPSKIYVPDEEERVKTPWTLPISLFKDYKFDNKAKLNKCFEFDWASSKVEKVIKNPEMLAKCKEVMRASYKRIRESYKYYSAIGASGGLFCVGQNAFTEFCQQANLINNTTFKLADMDFNLKAVLYQPVKGNPLNPANELVRFEFMEIFLRIAIDKYFKSGEFQSQDKALSKLLADMKPYMKGVNSNKWRWGHYICEDVDLMLKKYIMIVKKVYRMFNGKYTKPGARKFMSLDEFQDLCMTAGIVNEDYAAREMGVSYNLAMMTQIDELSKRRHIEMQFVEFIEALSRAAYAAAIPYVIIDPKTREKTIIETRDKPLTDKLEAIMPLLLKLLPKHTQEKYKWPEESPLAVMNVKPMKKKTLRNTVIANLGDVIKNKDLTPKGENPFSGNTTPRASQIISPRNTDQSQASQILVLQRNTRRTSTFAKQPSYTQQQSINTINEIQDK